MREERGDSKRLLDVMALPSLPHSKTWTKYSDLPENPMRHTAFPNVCVSKLLIMLSFNLYKLSSEVDQECPMSPPQVDPDYKAKAK